MNSDNSYNSDDSITFYDIEDELMDAIYGNDVIQLYQLIEENEFTDEEMEDFADICIEDKNIKCLEVLMEFCDFDRNFILFSAIEYGFFELFKRYYDEETDKEICFIRLINCIDENITEEVKDGRMRIMDYL